MATFTGCCGSVGDIQSRDTQVVGLGIEKHDDLCDTPVAHQPATYDALRGFGVKSKDRARGVPGLLAETT
jgi:hypothetical protein